MSDFERHFRPCHHCIANLRNKLFNLKSNHGMFSLDDIKKLSNNGFIQNFDIYSGNSLPKGRLPNNYNWEHIIPAFIMAKRVQDSDINLTLNKEPYHDPHLVHPTSKIINDQRDNFPYGQLVRSRVEASETRRPNIIANENKFVDLDRENINVLSTSDEKKDIYILKRAYRTDPIKKGCDFGYCIFQPPINTRGAIARAIFYFYLMYGYNPNVRPLDVEEKPWLFHGVKNNDNSYIKQYGILDNNWKIFFEDNIMTFRDWAYDKISPEELIRNIDIIKLTRIPNIFTAHVDGNMEYIQSNFEMIDDLLFGKDHDHNKYLNIELFNSFNINTLKYVYNNTESKESNYSLKPLKIYNDPSTQSNLSPQSSIQFLSEIGNFHLPDTKRQKTYRLSTYPDQGQYQGQYQDQDRKRW